MPKAELHVHLEATMQPHRSWHCDTISPVPFPPPIRPGSATGSRSVRADRRRDHVATLPGTSVSRASKAMSTVQPADTTLRCPAGQEHGVIGLGIGGDEEGCPPEPFAHAFREAKRKGLGSVPHAGESLRPWGADHVRGSIDTLGADRIGHGIGAIRNPHLLALLVDRAIPLEVCPTSNVRTRACPRIGLHPFPHLDAMGLTLTVNSDGPSAVRNHTQGRIPPHRHRIRLRPCGPRPDRPQRLRLRTVRTGVTPIASR